MTVRESPRAMDRCECVEPASQQVANARPSIDQSVIIAGSPSPGPKTINGCAFCGIIAFLTATPSTLTNLCSRSPARIARVHFPSNKMLMFTSRLRVASQSKRSCHHPGARFHKQCVMCACDAIHEMHARGIESCDLYTVGKYVAAAKAHAHVHKTTIGLADHLLELGKILCVRARPGRCRTVVCVCVH